MFYFRCTWLLSKDLPQEESHGESFDERHWWPTRLASVVWLRCRVVHRASAREVNRKRLPTWKGASTAAASNKSAQTGTQCADYSGGVRMLQGFTLGDATGSASTKLAMLEAQEEPGPA